MKSRKTKATQACSEQAGEPAPKPRRRYHSPRRQMQSAETLERILAAGVELVQGPLEWDITQLNARITAGRAGVSVRTVQRYFANEHMLRDAVLKRAVEKAGISLEKLTLDNFSKTTARMCKYLALFPLGPSLAEPLTEPLKDPTYVVIDRERREAVLRAVTCETPDWSERERQIAAGVLDILWSLSSYERLVHSWALDTDSAARGLTWLIGMVNAAIREGRKPTRKR